ncbi:hypothetical protein GQ55_3G253400 [Panicum hallii var. hallii]|uniref:Uncharacterized protein n=1 Tax=Panicum hallii var. hallii TaxID=1504633 RepID=A0A2T7ED93_9POAL|nr:hypothetical protein GQ55_3G253400 [Panicum hallii var. hallii]
MRRPHCLPPTLTHRSFSTELSSGNGRPSRASTELSPRRPWRFPRARYIDFSSPPTMQSRGGRGKSTCRSGGSLLSAAAAMGPTANHPAAAPEGAGGDPPLAHNACRGQPAPSFARRLSLEIEMTGCCLISFYSCSTAGGRAILNLSQRNKNTKYVGQVELHIDGCRR